MPPSQLHICHLSLLNPAIHSRIFFKMALSQVAAGYRVSIIAQDPAPKPYMREGVEIVPMGVFGRLSWRRLGSHWKLRKWARRLAADVYQVHTVELLGLAKKLKHSLPNAKIIYDVHEDYVQNILHADYYAEWTRPKLAARVKAAQDDFCNWGDGVLYAEDCFQGILPFDPERTATVRNKFQAPADVPAPPRLQFQNPEWPTMLYTGTIAENWGVLRTVELWEMLNTIQPINLVIAGHSQDAALLDQLRKQVQTTGLQERFVLVGGKNYVPFEDLVALIKACTFGVALYGLKENIKNRIPTKFYEFMAHAKPLVFTENPVWNDLNAQYSFGTSLTWPPSPTSIAQLITEMHKPRKILPREAWSWESEAPVMLDLIRRSALPSC